MDKTAYQELIDQAARLSLADQRRLLDHLQALIEERNSEAGARSVLELQGLGKEIWEGIDVEEYVDRERVSWDG